MLDKIPPRWLIITAVAGFTLGVVGLYLGWSAWAPIALLAAEILTILAAIVLTTPSIQQSLAAQNAARTEAADAAIPPEQPQAD